jgi:serine/threonine protein kinase/outer membrane protein assembly factor BamD (BamD/ComL family)
MTGQTITHYRVGEKLGEGASAVVYRAEDLALGREVVIKFFSPDGDGSIARFQHEARTISSLNHPNICTIYEIGEHDGRHFLAMEMLDGQVLSEAIGKRPLKTDRLIDLGTQIADALDAAHSERIVHRDVKPANIFVTRSGRIKLLDFGVAVLLPRRVDPTAARSLFSTGGTIPYMSPEQARIEDLDHRTDLFSLGIVLYEMATGRKPFGGSTPADVLSAIVNQPPIVPRALNPAVPFELDRIITKALEKHPALRYQTASDLRSDLQRLKRDLDRASSVHAKAAPAWQWMRSSRWLRTAAVVGASAVVGSGWLAIAARARSGSAASTDVLRGPVPGADVELRSEIERPENMTAPKVERPAGVAPVRQDALPPRSPLAVASSPPSPSPSPSPSPPPPPAQPTGNDLPSPPAPDHFLIARQQIDLKLYDQAIDTLRKAAQDSHPQTAIDASFLIASVHDARGDTANAMSTYIEIANRFPDDPRAPEALDRLAESTLKSKRRGKEQDARRTLTSLVQKYPASPWAPRALLMRGDIEATQKAYQRDAILGGSVPTAAVTYREIVERYASSDAAAPALNKLARIYTDTKRFEMAAATFQALATRDEDDRYDAWFAAGEIYEKRLKDNARAKEAYSHVLQSSPHYAEARKRITM